MPPRGGIEGGFVFELSVVLSGKLLEEEGRDPRKLCPRGMFKLLFPTAPFEESHHPPQ